MSRGSVNLENCNFHTSHSQLDSPRSIAACRRLGISPNELLYRAPDDRMFIEGVDAQTANLMPDYARRRHEHYEAKRVAKLQACRAERRALLANSAVSPSQSPASPSSPSRMTRSGHSSSATELVTARDRALSALDMEKEEIARMQQRLLTKLNNTLAYEIRRAQTLDRAKERVDYANSRAEAERQHRQQQQIERDEMARRHHEENYRKALQEAEERRQLNLMISEQNKRDLRDQKAEAKRRKKEALLSQQEQRERQERRANQLKSIQDMQRAAIASKEDELNRREQQRLRAQEEQRQQLNRYHQEQRDRLNAKLNAAQQRNQQLADQKRAEFEEREAQAEQRRQEFDRARRQQADENRRRAADKEAALRNAQQQAEAILKQKQDATLYREQQTAGRMAERARQQHEEEMAKRRWEEEREQRRKMILEQSYIQQERRAQEILDKRAELNHRSEQATKQRLSEIRAKKLHEKMLEDDRREAVQRMARQQEQQRDELLQRIQADRERVESLQQETARLQQQRLKLRSMSERQTQHILHQFEKLKQSPEKLRELDPNNVDVVKLGFLSVSEFENLMSINDSPSHRRRSSSPPRSSQSARSVPQQAPQPARLHAPSPAMYKQREAWANQNEYNQYDQELPPPSVYQNNYSQR